MVAALGFGVSGPHGQAWFSERKLTRLIAQAMDGGLVHFDTAPFYGEAEGRLGRALASLRAHAAIVSTKTGTRRKNGRTIKDFSEASIRADVDKSLKRLRRDALDVLYLHGPTSAEIDAALPTLLALKAHGKIRALGVCGEGEALAHATTCQVDAIMGVYNLIDRRHAKIFERARADGITTVAIAPLARGELVRRSKRPASPSDLWRMARRARRGPLAGVGVSAVRQALRGIDGFSPAGAALAFVLQAGVVDVAMTTSTDAGRLAQSLDASRHRLGAAAIEALSALSLDPSQGRS